MKARLWLAVVLLWLAQPVLAQGLPTPQETETLAEAVAAGELPPVAERLPETPLVVDLAAKGRTLGRPGGVMKMFVTRAKDIRYMAAYGYARLVGYDANYDLVPDLLRDVTVSPDGRSVTLHMRPGHKWSDGKPFTTEDLRYWWEDVALNEDLSPKGPPIELQVDGQNPVVEVIDAVTIRYTWPAPNPHFLPALARARPIYIYRPAHYMKKYHARYADPEKLEERVHASGKRNWAALHNAKDNQYKFDNPKLPVLQPWVNTSKKNSQRFVLQRNPFYHRIDTEGLPRRIEERQRRQDPQVDVVALPQVSNGALQDER